MCDCEFGLVVFGLAATAVAVAFAMASLLGAVLDAAPPVGADADADPDATTAVAAAASTTSAVAEDDVAAAAIVAVVVPVAVAVNPAATVAFVLRVSTPHVFCSLSERGKCFPLIPCAEGRKFAHETCDSIFAALGTKASPPPLCVAVAGRGPEKMHCLGILLSIDAGIVVLLVEEGFIL